MFEASKKNYIYQFTGFGLNLLGNNVDTYLRDLEFNYDKFCCDEINESYIIKGIYYFRNNLWDC